MNESPERLATTLDPATLKGRLRATPEDFQVDEVLGFEPDGEGEHLFVQLCKTRHNTEDVASKLARAAGLPRKQVSYSGMKDYHAVTSQWFSLHDPGGDDTLMHRLRQQAVQWEGIEILRMARHSRKLRRGTHRANHFVIRLTELHGDPRDLDARLDAVRRRGVPNYFGPQRFGRGGGNLEKLSRHVEEPRRLPRAARSLLYSTARAYIFNQQLSRRVADGSWLTGMDGDIFALTGSTRFFASEVLDDTLRRRLAEHDISPTGVLAGRARPDRTPTGPAAALEAAVLSEHSAWLDWLAGEGVEQDRRSLRLVVGELDMRSEHSDAVTFAFTLPKGGYATAVLRELITDVSGGLEPPLLAPLLN